MHNSNAKGNYELASVLYFQEIRDVEILLTGKCEFHSKYARHEMCSEHAFLVLKRVCICLTRGKNKKCQPRATYF